MNSTPTPTPRVPTIFNLDDFTYQQVFDFVLNHLYVQGEKAADTQGCRYRTPSGLSCAVGCLIPDHEYSYTYEGSSVEGFRSIHRIKIDKLDLLVDLQGFHDAFFTCREDLVPTNPRLLRILKKFGLTFPELGPVSA